MNIQKSSVQGFVIEFSAGNVFYFSVRLHKRYDWQHYFYFKRLQQGTVNVNRSAHT